MNGQEIVQEIDKTLDQLISNAQVISSADLKELSEIEVEAFQKTQESLLQHLLHMDQCLASKQTLRALDARSACVKIREKRLRFEQLKTQYSENIDKQIKRSSILSKRCKKKFFDFRFRKKKLLLHALTKDLM